MSTFYPYRLECACGHARTVDLVAGIHITRLPDARRQILAGTFQVYPCPACGVRTAVTAPTIYTDFDRNQYVAVETTVRAEWPTIRARQDKVFEDSFTSGPPIATEMGLRFRKRCVFGFPALREKLTIWDAALDDLVVEAVKGDLYERLGVEPADAVFRLAAVLPGGHLTFSRFEPTAPIRPSRGATQRAVVSAAVDVETVLAEVYQRRLDQRTQIAADFPWLSDDWLVDLHDGLETLATA